MRGTYSKTYAYLSNFKEKLKTRSGYKRYFARKGGAAPFYALYNVGPYTLAPWKVLWPEVGHSVAAGVVGMKDGKPAIPDHTLIFVGCQTKQEAHYICGILNSAPADLLVRGYVALHPSPHVLETLRIPRFDPKDSEHVRIADLSMEAHDVVSDPSVLAQATKKLDKSVGKVFGLPSSEVELCLASLDELARVSDDLDEVEELADA